MSSQIGVKYGGEDIPGSPFEMTSNADTSDVIGDGSRKSSGKVNKIFNDLWLVTTSEAEDPCVKRCYHPKSNYF